MTVGGRIAQKRKELGLSQEGLGEKLGVSRQAIYKWESDSALPEIEKLIALSHIFDVSVGWLLGVEENAQQETPQEDAEPLQGGELTQTQLDMVEEIVRRYQQEAKPKRRRWPWVLAVIVLIIVFARLFSMLNQLQQDYNRVQSSVDYIDRNVDNQISSITNRVEDILNQVNSFTAEDSAEITGADLTANTVTFALRAVPKTYTEGMTAVFRAQYGEDTEEISAVLGADRAFTAELTCPLTNRIDLSVTFLTEGKEELQPIQSFDELYSATFPAAYLITNPLYWAIQGDTLQTRDFHVDLGTGYTNDRVPQAQVTEMRLGLFRDRKLVYWLERLEEQPETYQGDWGDSIFFRNPQDYTLDREGTYCLAAVVTDEYGREVVLGDLPIHYVSGETGSDGSEEPGDWVYVDQYTGSGDSADWVY